MQKLDFDLSQRREEEEEEENIPTESEKRPSFPRSGKGNPPTRYHEDVGSDGDSDYDDIYAPPSSSSASSSENSDEEPYVRDTSIITLTTP